MKTKPLVTLGEACRELGISQATGKNWIRRGLLTPVGDTAGEITLEKGQLRRLRKKLDAGEVDGLRSRRNKSRIGGSRLYQGYISKTSPNMAMFEKLQDFLGGNPPEEACMAEILARCGELLLQQAWGQDESWKPLVEDLRAMVRKKLPELPDLSWSWVPGEDTLGFLYLSLRHMGDRKALGAYYTKPELVQQLLGALWGQMSPQGPILDPCCGTGSFLLQLPADVDPAQIYGLDLDSLSVAITRINLALKYPGRNISWLYEQISQGNYLEGDGMGKAPWIIGNPPWGSSLTEKERKLLKKRYVSAGERKPDTCDLFLEESLGRLLPGGCVAFVLPEAVIHVRSHGTIRKLLAEKTNPVFLNYLGEAFHGVQCPSILLGMQYTGLSMDTRGLRVKRMGEAFTIETRRSGSEEEFPFLMKDSEYKILRKLEGWRDSVSECCENQKTYLKADRQYLAHQADFALGIVTGNNKEFLRDAPEEGFEPVLRGSDVKPYGLEEPSAWLKFEPKLLQQTAPESMYRATEKLVYRFVSRRIQMALDYRGSLTLNSCNVLIPRIPDLSVPVVMAMLNSSMAQFYYVGKFHSMKVLRSHLEQIPLAVPEKEKQAEIESMVEKLSREQDEGRRKQLYEGLDEILAGCYGLTQEEYRVIDCFLKKNY